MGFFDKRRKKSDEAKIRLLGRSNQKSTFLKSLPLNSLEQIPIFLEELQKGNILILNTEPMSRTKAQIVDRQRAIDQIRGVCRELGGEIAQLGESYYMVITPPSIKIWVQPPPMKPEKPPESTSSIPPENEEVGN
ncbi:MAG: cell division protein SepF [Candidatus Ranarchaeia archaeon]